MSAPLLSTVSSRCLVSCTVERLVPSLSHGPRPSISRTLATAAPEGRRYGQPAAQTHAHLLKDGEVTPGISAKEYEARRRRLIDGLPDGSIVVALGATMQYSSPGIFYRFRQQSDLFYLCGWQEPDSALVLEKNSSARGYRMSLFVPPSDASWETWHGARTGFDGAIGLFGADDAVDVDLLPSRLNAWMNDRYAAGPIYLDVPDHPTGPAAAPKERPRRSFIERMAHRPSTSAFLSSLASSASTTKARDVDAIFTILGSPDTLPRGLKPLKNAVEPLRLIKSDSEIACMRRAADIAAEAHAHAMSFARPGRPEAELVAHFEYRCAMGGPVRSAFVPVCASGDSALVLHYTDNNRLLPDGGLVLFDAGCEYAGYASDITRTFPISGSFSGPQRDLYAAVLAATKAVTELCTERAGRSLRGLHRESTEMLRRELAQLGMKLNLGDLERRLYPHFVGHWLGLELHDTPTCDRSLRLQSGMVMAVEPGIYIPYDDTFPKHFQGLAVRIEEEVHVRDDDFVLLSANCPREIVDVEACCQKSPGP